MKRMLFFTLLFTLVLGCSSENDTPQSVIPFEPTELFPGGETTNTFQLGSNAFIYPAENIPAEDKTPFFTGNSFFNQNWVTAPASTITRDGLGPTFNARSCSGCHFKDGRAGTNETSGELAPVGLLFRLSVLEGNMARPEAHYGGQFQPLAVMNVPGEGEVRIHWEEINGSFADGTTFTLRKPRYEFDALSFGEFEAGTVFSPRITPAMIGLGLLEAIPQETLFERIDAEDGDGDGISGRASMVLDLESQTMRIGRFGWKAEMPTVLQQSAGAFNGDIGITSRIFPKNNCPDAQEECVAHVKAQEDFDPEIELRDKFLDAVDFYASTLAVPVRRNAKDEEVLRGKNLFHQAKCASCHVPSYQTGTHKIPALSNQTIWPYTDLLLHDMGDGLADGRPVGDAGGSEWKTPPLWGLGLVPDVNGHQNLLHDGRARGFAEAVLWHGGEAEQAKDAFIRMTKEERDALVAFLGSL